MRVIIEGTTGEGKSKLAWHLYHLLNGLGVTVVCKDDEVLSDEEAAKKQFSVHTTVEIVTQQTLYGDQVG